MKLRCVIGSALLALSALSLEQVSPADHSHPRLLTQAACEQETLRAFGAEEVLSGSEYEIFLDVARAFGLTNTPRLYFFPTEGNAYYIAGSVSQDGRGKIIMSRRLVELMGNPLAVKGVMAHEVAHLMIDIHGATSCNQRFLQDPETERAADALAASKVGFDSPKAFLLRVKELTGETKGEMASRFRALEKLEAQENERR